MIFLLILFAVGVSCGKFPPEVKLCHRSDPNFQKCVAKNIGDSLKYLVNGVRELGIPPLEPLFIEQLGIEGQPSQSVSLDQKYSNIKLHGTVNSSFEKYFEIDLDKCRWSTDAVTPVVRMEADYEIKGQLLVFPINSHGKCNITQYGLVNRHTMTCEKYTKNNETYLRVLSYKMDMKPERIGFEFGNIIEQNEQISKQIVKTLNENSLSIFSEVKGGIEQAFSIIYMKIMNNVFSKIPLNQIFLD